MRETIIECAGFLILCFAVKAIGDYIKYHSRLRRYFKDDNDQRLE